MGIEAPLAYPTPSWPWWVRWPSQAAGFPGQSVNANACSYGPGAYTLGPSLWAPGSNALNNFTTLAAGDGMMYARQAGSIPSPSTCWAFLDPVAPNVTGAPTGFLIGRADLRYLWIRMLVRWSGAGAAAATSGWALCFPSVAPGAGQWAPNGSASGDGIYIVGDGAGAFNWEVWDASPAQLDSVALGSLDGPGWHLLDHRITGAAQGRPGSYELQLDGATVVERTYQGAAAFPYQVGPLTIGRRCIDTMDTAWWEVRGGPQTADGVPLTE